MAAVRDPSTTLSLAYILLKYYLEPLSTIKKKISILDCIPVMRGQTKERLNCWLEIATLHWSTMEHVLHVPPKEN